MQDVVKGVQEVVAKEVAEADFERFCNAQRIDLDFEDFTDEDRQAFEGHQKKIVKAIRRGSMVVNDQNEAVFTCNAGTVVFKQPKASCLLAMDRAKKGQDTKAMFDVMGDMVGQHPSVFGRMDTVDAKVCLAVASLFLGS